MAELRFTISRENVSGSNYAPKTFTLKQGAETPIRIGRAPGNDIIVDSRGVSQYHTELRVMRVDGEKTARLCVRDLSMNGTGLKRLDGKAPTHLEKRTDVPLADGHIMLVPMMLKVSQESSDRAWLKVELEGSRGENGGGVADAAPQSQAAQQAADDEDVEKARMKFVELLLKTREVSTGTTYEEAKKLLGSSADWHAVDESTRKECFDIFVGHLGSHQSSKKKDKKKGKDKGEKGKAKKNKGKEEEGAGAVATPEPKVANQREEKKRRERRGGASRSAGGSPDRKRRREKKGRSASPGDRDNKRRRRVRSGSA